MNYKELFQRTLPNLYDFLRWRYGHPAAYKRVADAVVSKYGRKVVEGPFQGMEYVEEAAGSAYTPKLLGCYEMEIHQFIKRIVEKDYTSIIDVGCAEGYYAVGLARLCCNTHVFAFDCDVKAQALCAEMARRNNVDKRIEIAGCCDASQLKKISLCKALLICDTEGYERELLNPEAVPDLKLCDILVELHEPLCPGVTEVVLSRFQLSHEIVIVNAVKRQPAQHPLVHFLPPQDQSIALTESRPSGQTFAFMTALEY